MRAFVQIERSQILVASLGLLILAILPFYELLSPRFVINAMDTLTQDYFWKAFFQEQLRTGPSFMTWNPYLNGGASFEGGLHLIFKPITLALNLLFSPNFAITLAGSIHLFIAGLFTLLYARLIGLKILPAFLSAVFFMVSTQLVSLFNAGHINKLNTIAYLPVILFFLERAFLKRRFIDFFVVSLPLSLQLYEGHLQISFYTCILVGIYFIWRSLDFYREKRDQKELGRIYLHGTSMVLFFFLLSAATFAWWLDFKELSERSSGTSYEFATSWSMPKKELLTYIVPEFFGIGVRNYKDPGEIDVTYWGEMPFTQTSDYLGILPLLLALLAILRFRNRYVTIFLSVAILFQVLALGRYTPLYYPFYEFLGFKFFRVPKMNLFIVAFAVAVMAGHGAQWLSDEMKKKDEVFFKRFLGGFALFIVIFVMVTLYGQINQGSLVKEFLPFLQGEGMAYNPNLAVQRYENAVRSMWLAGGLMITALALLSLRLVRNLRGDVYLLVLLSFFVIDISLLNHKFINGLPVSEVPHFSRDTAVEYFEQDKGLYRVLNAVRDQSEKMVAYQATNKYMFYKIQSLTGYEAVNVARYADILGVLSLEGRLLDFLNVKYVVMDRNAVRGGVGERAGKYEIVVDSDVKILRNDAVIPRVFPVHRAAVVSSKDSLLNILKGPGFNPAEVVLLDESLNEPLSASPLPQIQSAVQVDYGQKEIRIAASMADNGFVVLSEKYYPGWRAFLDGKETKIHRANYAFRAVYVPKGDHEVVMRYASPLYRNGLIVTALSVSFFIVVLLYSRFSGKGWQGCPDDGLPPVGDDGQRVEALPRRRKKNRRAK